MKIRSLLVVLAVAGCSEMPSIDAGSGGGGGRTGGGTGTGGGGGTGGGTTGGGTGGGGAASGVALDEFCAKYSEASCAFAVRCGSATPGVDCQKLAVPQRFSLINARQDCVSDQIRAGLDAGRTTFDGTRAASCFDAVQNTVACNATLQFFDPACAEVFDGTAALNASCYSSSDCAPGLYCDSTARTCPGTCKPRVPAGGVSTGSGSCAVGSFSWAQNDGGATCRTPIAPGDSCAAQPGILFPMFCAGANTCLSAADGGQTCQPFKAAGTACSAFASDCALGTTCAGGDDGGVQCVPLRKSGQSCAGGGLGVPCQDGLSCTNNVCSPLVGALGTCFEDRDCIAGYLCGTGQVCRPFAGPDAGCNTANFQGDCAVGLFCNTTSARCEAQRGLGAPCTGSECSVGRGLTCLNPGDGGVSRCSPSICLAP